MGDAASGHVDVGCRFFIVVVHVHGAGAGEVDVGYGIVDVGVDVVQADAGVVGVAQFDVSQRVAVGDGPEREHAFRFVAFALGVDVVAASGGMDKIAGSIWIDAGAGVVHIGCRVVVRFDMVDAGPVQSTSVVGSSSGSIRLTQAPVKSTSVTGSSASFSIQVRQMPVSSASCNSMSLSEFIKYLAWLMVVALLFVTELNGL